MKKFSGLSLTKQWTVAIVGIIVFFWLATSVYVLNQRDRAVVLSFGKPIDNIGEPGIHMKFPAPFQTIKKVSNRFFVFDGPSMDVLNKEQKVLVVDTYGLFAIDNAITYVTKFSGERSRILDVADDQVFSQTKNTLGKLSFREVVVDRRAESEKRVADLSTAKLVTLGLRVGKIGINQVTLHPDNLAKLYERMSQDRMSVSAQYLSEGRRAREAKIGQASADRDSILAHADIESRKIRGTAEARAARLYASIMDTNPEFYKLMESLRTAESLPDEDVLLILNEDDSFLKYLLQPL